MREMVLFALLLVLGLPLVQSYPASGEGKSDLVTKRSKRALRPNYAKLWNVYEEDGKYIIPYVIKVEADTDHNITELMETAVKDYNRYTCILFRPRTTEESFITVRFVSVSSSTCGYSLIGHVEHLDWVYINLACLSPERSIVHELQHKVLFNHEHVRPDRDDYFRNIASEHLSTVNDFEKYKVTSGFDIFSVSNYAHMLKHPKEKLWPTPHRLSHDDIKGVNAAYGCPDTLEGRGCYKSALPMVVGNGSFYPIVEIYESMQAVRLICDDGYIHENLVGRAGMVGNDLYDGEAYSYCENGQFIPTTLTCRKVECADVLRNCGEMRRVNNNNKTNVEFCSNYLRDTRYKHVCRAECGRCGDGVNFCTQYPTIYGYGHIHRILNDKVIPYFAVGEQIRIICDEGFTAVGPTTATCTNGKFDMDHFQCVTSNPPNEEELCSRVDDSSNFSNDKCSRLRLDVGPGIFVPDQGCYNNRDFVQLLCDDGFHPEGSDLAQCQDGRWIHTAIKCVQFDSSDCMDTSGECEDYKSQGLCESADIIGFMRKRCLRTCGWCGKCQGSPIFDRMKSELLPIKFSYEHGENITIQCFPGWRQTGGKSSSQCQNGEFHPPVLDCEPIDEVCVYSPDMFGSNYKSVSPNMLYYPSGSILNIRCSTKQHDDQVICENGHFLPTNFTCPDNSLRRSCNWESLYEDSVMFNKTNANLLQLYSYLKETYEDGEQVDINCDDDGHHMTATCHGGLFTYTNICSVRTKRSCYAEDLPPIYGNGVIEPVKDVYLHREEIVLKCAEGSSSVSQPAMFNCNDGIFGVFGYNVSGLICTEDGCSDISSDCQPEQCHEEDVRRSCRRTCGVCEGLGCSSSSVGWSFKSEDMEEKKEIYRDGEVMSVLCYNGVVSTTCVNGQFDQLLPLCWPVEDIMFNYGVAMQKDSLGDVCTLFEECENRLLRALCAKTCDERLSAKMLAE